jgi:hypothetical protein
VSDDELEHSERDADEAAYDSTAASGIPPLDFNIVVLSLNTSALIHLGEGPDAEGRTHENLPMARHTIDMLCILEEKTRGNLTGAEERLLHQVLFDLRMRFTSKAQVGAAR